MQNISRHLFAGVSSVIHYEETKKFPQIKQPCQKVLNRNLARILHPIRLQLSKNLAEITDLTQDSKRRRRLASQI